MNDMDRQAVIDRVAHAAQERLVQRIAERGTILRGVVGSTVHGLALDGHDDRDEMGVCVEPPEYVVGLRHFEQYVYRTAIDRAREAGEPTKGYDQPKSQAGDLDLTVYSLRKWCRLALDGNPTVLLLLFLPQASLVVEKSKGRRLRDLAPAFASRKAGRRFLGYLESQRQRLVGERGQKDVNRRELTEKFGYDTKYAMHMLRLGHQGIEYMEAGRLTLPMPEPVRAHLLAVRLGMSSLQAVLTECGELEARLKDLLDTSPLPPEPDARAVDRFLYDTYRWAWADLWGNR